MLDISKCSLADLVHHHKNSSHHIRLIVAPVMYHHYCRNLEPQVAKNLTCALLDISPEGFEYSLRKKVLSKINTYRRDQMVLDMRCRGMSYKRICLSLKLSRVQVWRIIKSFESKVKFIDFLQNTHVKTDRLYKSEIDQLQQEFEKNTGEKLPHLKIR